MIDVFGGKYEGRTFSDDNAPSESGDLTDDLGFGVAQWMGLLRNLIGLFAVFTVLGGGLGYVFKTSGHISDSLA